MSNLVKFLLMALIWAVFFFVTFKSCIEPEYCPDDGQAGITEEVVTPPVVPPVAEAYSLQTLYGDGAITTGALWDAERDGLLSEYRADPNQTLEIYGHYYPSEPAPEGYTDLGLQRAANIKALLVAAGLPEDIIETASRRLNTDRPAEGEAFDPGSFAWAQPDVADRVVRVSDNEIEILFPYNENTAQLSPGTEDYLRTLAEQLQTTGERVAITGHTDDRGTEEYNQGLGQRRAEFLKSRLVSYGAPADLISTTSAGESAPTATNATEAGRRQNRRAALVVQAQ